MVWDNHNKLLKKYTRQNFGDAFLFNIEYSSNKKTIGEIDAYGYINDELYLIEYKQHDTRDGYKKAKKQLKRHIKYAIPSGEIYHCIYMHNQGKYKELFSNKE